MQIFENQEQISIKKNKRIEVLEINEHLFIKQIYPGVIIMPYTLDDEGNPSKIGIINEVLEQRPGGMAKTLITGTPDEDDDNIFQTAIRELKEESGFKVPDIKRWKFLGTLYTSKLVLNSNPCFSVNITSIVAEEKTTDGSTEEKDSKFELISIEEALSLEDSLISTLFIKTFKDIFIKKENNEQPTA